MIVLHSWAAVDAALQTPLGAGLKSILRKFYAQLSGCEGMNVRFVVIEPGDAPEHIDPPPLINRLDGSRFGDPGWFPPFEHVQNHGGWFAIVFVTADDGSGTIVLVPDAQGVDGELLKLCRAYADAD